MPAPASPGLPLLLGMVLATLQGLPMNFIWRSLPFVFDNFSRSRRPNHPGLTSASSPGAYVQDRCGFAVYINCWHRQWAIVDGSRADQSDPVSHSKRWRRTLVLSRKVKGTPV